MSLFLFCFVLWYINLKGRINEIKLPKYYQMLGNKNLNYE